MTRAARLLLASAAAVTLVAPLHAREFYFRLLNPGTSGMGQSPGSDAQPPAPTGNTVPPPAGTTDGPTTAAPVLRLTGVAPTSTQSGGAPIDARYTLENANGAVTYEVVSGNPPPELTLGGDGSLSGTVRRGGRYAFVVRATDQTPTVSEMTTSMQVVPEIPQITVHMPDGPIFTGSRFAAPISVDNGVDVTDFTFAETPPSFLSLVGNEMRGAPGAADAGTQFYVVQGNDAFGQSGMSFGTFEVLAPSLTISGLPDRVRAAAPFAATLDTNLPDGTWSVGSVPAGISGSVDGTTLTAAAAAAATETPYSLSVSRTRQDGASATASAPVVAVPALSVSGGGAVLARVGRAVASAPKPTALHPLDPARGVTWTLGAGALPPGLSIDPTAGSVAGTPAAGGEGDYPGVAAKAIDAADGSAATGAPFAVRVVGALAFQGLPDSVRITRGYAQAASPSFRNNVGGGELTAAGLPPGIGFQQSSGTGTLSGAPQAAGSYVATFAVTDPADGARASHDVTYAVVEALVAAQPSVTMRVSQTKPYDPGLSGQGPYSWTLSSGALPPGLQADPATLVVSGSPTQTGSYAATYAVTDATGAQGSVTLSFTVNPAPTLAASKAFTVRVNRPRSAPSELVATGVAQPRWSTTTPSDWFSIDPDTGVVTAAPVYTPPPGNAARLMVEDVETTGSTTTQVSPGSIYRFTVKITDLADGAVATVSYMVKAYADILANPSFGTQCYTMLVDNSRAYTASSGCKMSYSGVMSTAPVSDFGTIVPAMEVLTASASPLPAQVGLTPYAQMSIPAGLSFEWDGAYRFTDPVDGQQFITPAIKVSSAPAFTVPTDYRDPSTLSTSQGYFVNGNAFRLALQGSVTGGTAPYAYALTAYNANNTYGLPANASLATPPYGAFDASTGIWSGTATAAPGQATGYIYANLRVSDARGRYTDRLIEMVMQERTAGYVCAQFSGNDARRQAVFTDATGIKGGSFQLAISNVAGAGRTGSGSIRLAAYPGIDGNGTPTGTPTVVATGNYYNNGYTQAVRNIGNSSTRVTSKVWAIELTPAPGNTDPVPVFSGVMSDQNSFPSGCYSGP